jgi:signal transduction histidine kinase
MSDGGVLTVATRGDEDTVSLAITDTGIGIPEDVVDKIFEPFFTTKEKDALGLGLAVVYGIVRRHQGKIDIDSTPGEGTTITVTLPRKPDIDLSEDNGDPLTGVEPLTVTSFPATEPGA